MFSAGVLLLGGLVTMGVPEGPYYGNASSMVSCNKQGSVYDSAWINNINTPTSAQVVLNGTAIWTASSTASLIIPAFAPACSIDTDDTSAANCAVSWAATVTVGGSNYNYAYCSVNGKAPFQLGVNYNTSPPTQLQATNSWVALCRQYGTYDGETVILVGVVFNWFLPNGNAPYNVLYGQVFYVSPSTGQPLNTPTPVVLNGWGNPNYHVPGTLALGGIAGDDYGNFVVSYVRQYNYEYSNPVGIYASTMTASGTAGIIEYQLSSSGSEYCWSRVACYHGTSSTSGGFVLAATPNGSADINIYRCTTNWTNSVSVAATNHTDTAPGYPYQFPGTPDCWQFSLACERDTPGNYLLTWPTGYDPAPYNEDYYNQAANNIVYQLFAGDSAKPVIQLTYYYGTYSYYNGSTPPPDYGDQPSVAVCDHSYGATAQIDWIETNTTSDTGSVQTEKVAGP